MKEYISDIDWFYLFICLFIFDFLFWFYCLKHAQFWYAFTDGPQLLCVPLTKTKYLQTEANKWKIPRKKTWKKLTGTLDENRQ